MATLGSRLLRQDRARFVGRAPELELFDRLFGDEPEANVALVHGPGGIGKSTLLREVARRGEEKGWTPHWVEGRELPPVPDALEDAIAGARDEERPLLVFDTYERMTALGGYLRRELLPGMPERTVAVIAGRTAPERGWFEGGWESLAVEVELRGLAEKDALALLRAHGLPEDERAKALVSWADGSPLALTLAASAPGVSPEADADLMRVLVRRLAEAEFGASQRGTLAVAAIARVTTPELLRAVLPEGDFDWLASRTVVEPLGAGVTLHDLVRRAMNADLRRRDPERERELRRRIADFLHARAVAGEHLLSIDLAHLVDSPVIKWGYGWEGSVNYRIDDVRTSDLEELDLSAGNRRYFEEAPERVAVARDPNDEIAGYVVSMAPGNAPEFTATDPLLGPWLEHARATAPAGDVVIWRASVDLTGKPDSGVQAMLGVAGILRSGVGNPRYAYSPTRADLPGAIEFAEALGARHVPELDYRAVQCRVIDYGPGGLLGAQRDVVYRELGLTPPASAAAPEAVKAGADDVRSALRNFKLPHKLAESPLATGTGQEERAESVRVLLREAADRTFAGGEDDAFLRRVLDLGYLDAASSHEIAASELALSRAAYFRRLKQASERLAETLRS
ncbi:MAG: AAA family ATPase [Thermoleophilaceae bacterium]|nr:AAA family ATPase [Thermoleophilaceae bacterium]